MLLNLLRVEGIDPEYLIIRSFHQYQMDGDLPSLRKGVQTLAPILYNGCFPELEELEKQHKSTVIQDETTVVEVPNMMQFFQV